MKTIHLFLVLAFTVILGTTACNNNAKPGMKKDAVTGELYDLTQPPECLITIHPIVDYPRGEDDELILPNSSIADSRPVWVKMKPEFHSSVVMEITPLPTNEKGYYKLRLKLSPRGEEWWDKMINDNYQQKMAIALDGRYLTTFTASDPSSTEDVVVEKTAKGSIVHRHMAEQKKAETNPKTKKAKGVTPDQVMMDKPGWVIFPGPFHEHLTAEIVKNSKRNYFYYEYEAKQRAKAEAKKAKDQETDDPDKKFLLFLEDNGVNFLSNEEI